MSDPPFALYGPDPSPRAVMLSVPHAGRLYPPDVVRRARAPFAVLRTLEDRHADALALPLAAQGFAVMVAHVPRAVIDLNRDEDEWDTQLVHDALPTTPPSSRVRAGLGLVPVRLHRFGALWHERIGVAEVEARLAAVHRPWHRQLGTMLEATRNAHGAALLVDLHSMPQQPDAGPQLVIGDRYGQTAAPELVELLLGIAEGSGLRVARNAPYAGAHGIARHGRRGSGVEALQIEIDRSLYLDAAQEPVPSAVAALSALLSTMALAADGWIRRDSGLAVAAE